MSERELELEIDKLRRNINAQLRDIRANIAAEATSATNQAARLTALEGREQRVNQAIGPLVAATPLDVTVTWPTAWPDTGYGVYAQITTGNAVLGQVFCTPKSGSKTAQQCVVTVLATVAVATAGLDVLGVRA